MALTAITITGTFLHPDGTPAAGTVCATLSDPIVNGVDSIEPAPICGVLNGTGQLVAQALTAFIIEANDDTATTPVGTHYTFAIEVDDAPYRTFDAVVPHAAPGATIDILTLEEAAL